MENKLSPLPRRTLCLVLLALTVAGLGACGDGDEEQEAQTQSLTFSLVEEAKRVKVLAPQTAETGFARITLENSAKRAGDVQLIRVEGDHSAKEVIAKLEGATGGKAFPAWFFTAGGVGSTPAGSRATVTQVLEPGTYYAVNTEIEGQLRASNVAAVEVTGTETEDRVPKGEATIEAVDYAFESQQLPSGGVRVDFENGGDQPHHLLASKLVGKATAADVERAFESESGEPPLDDSAFQGTAVLEGGESQSFVLDLEPGRYVLYCFVSDRQGGKPHALSGMVDEVRVK